MPHILAASPNETISEESGTYYPFFYSVFARSAQSAEMLQNALRHTAKKRRFVVKKHNRGTVLFFTITG